MLVYTNGENGRGMWVEEKRSAQHNLIPEEKLAYGIFKASADGWLRLNT